MIRLKTIRDRVVCPSTSRTQRIPTGSVRFLILVAMGLLFLCKAVADPRIGDRWPTFHLKDSLGETKEWAPGRATVIAFCAYWCDTWKVQVPRLLGARKVLSGLPVDFITVSIDGRWSEVAHDNQGLPLWLDNGGEWAKAQGVDRVPTTVVLDPEGEVRFVGGGVLRQADIVDAVRSASQPIQSAGTLYLTFDDFPAVTHPEDLLDLLRSLDVPATLFCVASRLESQAAVFKRAIVEGHALQCHSWDHDASHPQLDRCQAEFKRVLGFGPTLYRAPGSERIVGESVHHAIVDPYDFERPSEKELIRRVLGSVRDQAVIQLHAGVSTTQSALPDIIANLRKRGFKFKTFR